MMRHLALHIILPLVILATTLPGQAAEFVEPDYGFSFTVDKQVWKPAVVPVSTLGETCAVLTRDAELKELMVVFVRSERSEQPVTEDRLKSISRRLAQIASATQNAEVITNEVIELAGRKVVSFRYSGPGSGIGIGAGPVATVQHWLVFPRGRDLIVFQMTAPKESFESAYMGLQEIAKTAAIEDSRPAPAENRTFAEKELGLVIDYPPSPWIRGGYELGDFVVPGYSLRIWSAPSDSATTADSKSNYASRLAMFLQFPGRAYSAQELIDVSIPGLTSQLGARVLEQDVREVAGRKAMWLLVEGKGKTGSAITNSGNVATRQLWVAIPRIRNGNHSIVVFLLNCPSADYAKRLAEFQTMLKSTDIDADPVN